MLHWEKVASHEVVAMLAACVMGVIFMLRVLVALALDARHTRRSIEYQRANQARKHRPLATLVPPQMGKSFGHLALGVVRITTLMAQNTAHGEARPARRTFHTMTAVKPDGNDYASQPRSSIG